MAFTRSEITQRYRDRRLAEIAQMPKIPCACGCGELIPPINKKLKPATYKHNHHPGREGTQYKPGHAESPETKAKRIKRGEEHWSFGKPKPPEQIAKKIATHRARFGDNYISEEALERSRQRGRENTGDKNPFWKGGVSFLPYGPEFTPALKARIKERDNHTCQRCGITAEECPLPLHVHHVDADKMNNDPSNLVTTCGSCNSWFITRIDVSIEMFAYLKEDQEALAS